MTDFKVEEKYLMVKRESKKKDESDEDVRD